ncbi:MAG TPA: hypothetical protein VN814_16160 [Caulobacteraceae bacterium]|nr:hypothetical protein [Caulobacteraceae bacterium]
MKCTPIVAGLTALALISGGANALAGGVWDEVNTGQHEPVQGALTLANGIASTDVLFSVCSWSIAEWAPLRDKATEVAPRLFQQAGLSPQTFDATMERDRQNWLHDPQLSRTCAVSRAEEKRLRWVRSLVGWATSPDAP